MEKSRANAKQTGADANEASDGGPAPLAIASQNNVGMASIPLVKEAEVDEMKIEIERQARRLGAGDIKISADSEVGDNSNHETSVSAASSMSIDSVNFASETEMHFPSERVGKHSSAQPEEGDRVKFLDLMPPEGQQLNGIAKNMVTKLSEEPKAIHNTSTDDRPPLTLATRCEPTGCTESHQSHICNRCGMYGSDHLTKDCPKFKGSTEGITDVGGSSVPVCAETKNMAFPMKLHYIIENEQHIEWRSEGTMFEILSMDEFVATVMPRHFRTASMSSFVRNLNYYGFRKIKSGAAAGRHHHPDFIRGDIDRIKEMKRIIKKPKRRIASALEDARIEAAHILMTLPFHAVQPSLHTMSIVPPLKMARNSPPSLTPPLRRRDRRCTTPMPTHEIEHERSIEQACVDVPCQY